MNSLKSMKSRVQTGKQRLFVVMVVALLVAGLSSVGFADLRIVVDNDSDTEEIFFKNGWLRSTTGDGQWMIIDCSSSELTVVDAGRYWQGSITDFTGATTAATEELFTGEGADMMALLGQLFGGSGDSEPVGVRLTRVGTDTIAGFEATEYHVETGTGSQWQTYENIWMSTSLMELINREVGQCFHLMLDFEQTMIDVFSFMPDDMMAVVKSEEYRRLYVDAYPMRTTTKAEFFGMTFEMVSEVVEVNVSPLSEDLFRVPAGYKRMDNPMEMLFDS